MICPPKKEVSFIFYYPYFIGQPPRPIIGLVVLTTFN